MANVTSTGFSLIKTLEGFSLTIFPGFGKDLELRKKPQILVACVALRLTLTIVRFPRRLSFLGSQHLSPGISYFYPKLDRCEIGAGAGTTPARLLRTLQPRELPKKRDSDGELRVVWLVLSRIEVAGVGRVARREMARCLPPH